MVSVLVSDGFMMPLYEMFFMVSVFISDVFMMPVLEDVFMVSVFIKWCFYFYDVFYFCAVINNDVLTVLFLFTVCSVTNISDVCIMSVMFLMPVFVNIVFISVLLGDVFMMQALVTNVFLMSVLISNVFILPVLVMFFKLLVSSFYCVSIS